MVLACARQQLFCSLRCFSHFYDGKSVELPPELTAIIATSAPAVQLDGPD